MSQLYSSGWTPKNTPRTWDRTSISNDNAEWMLDKYGVRRPEKGVKGAVAWSDANGALRMLVSDMSDGRRITLRLNRGDWKLEIMPEGAFA